MITALCCRVSSMKSCHRSVSGEKSLLEFPENSRRIPGTDTCHMSNLRTYVFKDVF